MEPKAAEGRDRVMAGALGGFFLGMTAIGGVLGWKTLQGLQIALGTTAEVLFENGRLVWGALWMAGNFLGITA